MRGTQHTSSGISGHKPLRRCSAESTVRFPLTIPRFIIHARLC